MMISEGSLPDNTRWWGGAESEVRWHTGVENTHGEQSRHWKLTLTCWGGPGEPNSHLPTLTGSWPALSSAPVNTSLYSLGYNLAASAAATSPGPVDTLTRSRTSPARWSSSLTRSWTSTASWSSSLTRSWTFLSKCHIRRTFYMPSKSIWWLSEWYIIEPLWADL